jgi:hypothetical protein
MSGARLVGRIVLAITSPWNAIEYASQADDRAHMKEQESRLFREGMLLGER